MGSLIHIVLATYNGERFIREQLDSILGGTMDDFSIEVCEDVGNRKGVRRKI